MIRSSIIGAGGYAGAELVSLLAAHEGIEVVGLFGSEARAATPQRFDEIYPRFRGLTDLVIEPMSLDRVLSQRPQAVFLATPHEVSHEIVPELLDHGIVVLDLSAAFRLADPNAYVMHYGFTHRHTSLLAQAVYGLPERNAAAIAESNLIALPGCYPTSIILPLLPLIDAAILDSSSPVIADCTSGISGAGRSPALKSLFCEVSYQPYGVLSHRHSPEICQHSGVDVIFTPHLGPFDRGIVSTIHASVAPGFDESNIRTVLHNAYGDEPFVRLLPRNTWPSVRGVQGTNFCDIGLAFDADRRHLILVSAIDNLLKGAAGQAMQCFNIRFGFPQTAALSVGRKELSHA